MRAPQTEVTMPNDKKSLAWLGDASRVAFDIFGVLYAPLKKAIESGTAHDVLRESLIGSIRTAESVAVARVESRAGGPVSALHVAAVVLDDCAGDLEQLGQDEDAKTLRHIAARYRTTE